MSRSISARNNVLLSLFSSLDWNSFGFALLQLDYESSRMGVRVLHIRVRVPDMADALDVFGARWPQHPPSYYDEGETLCGGCCPKFWNCLRKSKKHIFCIDGMMVVLKVLKFCVVMNTRMSVWLFRFTKIKSWTILNRSSEIQIFFKFFK